MRIEPHQGRFAARIGITQNKQSFLETGARELRADYLAAVAAEGLDVHYVLTGERLLTDALDSPASDLLSDFLALPRNLQRVAGAMLRTMRDEAASDQPESRPTIHSRQLEYHADGTR